MTRARVVPVLLLSAQGLVKTVRFTKPRYLGDPINAVRIFNQKKVDELVLLDIDATPAGGPDFDRVEDIVSEAFMPVAYGGGITTVEQCATLFRRGVEKVVMNTAAADRPALVAACASRFGAQAVVVSIDARTTWGRYKVFVEGGRRKTGMNPAEAARRAEAAGAGEILLTSIDREGTYGGYDLDLIRDVAAAVGIPVIANGGARAITDFADALGQGGCSAVAAGSMFVYSAQGEGVLINYPLEAQLRDELWSRTS